MLHKFHFKIVCTKRKTINNDNAIFILYININRVTVIIYFVIKQKKKMKIFTFSSFFIFFQSLVVEGNLFRSFFQNTLNKDKWSGLKGNFYFL